MHKTILWCWLLLLPAGGPSAAPQPETEALTTLPETDTALLSVGSSEPTQQMDEVVVSEPLDRKADDLARPVTVLKNEALRNQVGPTIGATLSQQPGITNQSFGPGVGQPVIRGLAGPRVRVMENGIGNNDASNISPDHANSIEPSQAERIEVLRGPSTLLYGSGAIGGIVNVIDGRVPEKMPEHSVGGALDQNYNSALDETSTSLRVDGGEGQAVIHLDGFYRSSGNETIGGYAINESDARATNPELAAAPTIQNTYGYVANTHAQAQGGTAGLSWIGDTGYAGAAINHLENNYGIPPGGLPGEPAIRIQLWQTKYDFRGGLDHPFELADKLRVKFGYTDYKHVETEGGFVNTTWLSNSYEGRVEVTHKPLGPVRGQWGFQSVNGSVQASGEEATLPATSFSNYGLFAVESLETDPITYDFGLRIEPQYVTPQASSGYAPRSFLPVSGSVSALWKASKTHEVSLAFTESQRGPQAQELYVNGAHEATRSFEIGDPDLNMETSYNLELGWTLKQDWVKIQLNLFNNWVSDYIYAQYTGAVIESIPESQISQANALFRGYEANATLPLMESRYGLVDLTLFSDYTRGQFSGSGDGNVPRMPPLRFGAQLDHSLGDWSSFVRITRGQAQNYVAENESTTAGWVLLNVGLQYEAKTFQDAKLLFFLKGNNLLDQNIRNSTSYLKNFAPEPGRGVQLGVRLSY